MESNLDPQARLQGWTLRVAPASRQARWGSFGVSIAIHGGIVLAVALAVTVPEAMSDPEQDNQGVRVMYIIPPPPPPEPEPQVPARPETVAGAPQAVLATLSAADIGVELTMPDLDDYGLPGGETPAEILRPGLTDRRLWGPLPEEFRTLTLEQREELLIAGRLGAWNDSIAAVVAAEAAWRDWTFTDDDGNRWGVSDGQLHLGSITLPLPMSFEGSSQQRAYLREFEEISRQGANARVQQTLRERMEAIRERRDRERAAAQGDTTGAQR